MGILKTIQNSHFTDAELLRSYKYNNQPEMLAELFLRYYDLLYGTCIKYLKNQEDARDAVMNIYEDLPRKVQMHSIDNFKSWLYVVTRNHCLMQLRKEKKFVTVEYDGQVMQSEDFMHLDNVFEKERQLDALAKCMQELNEEQRRTVRMFYIDNKCYNEICDATGFEWNRVRSLIQNGRRNLKICMEENG